MQQVPKNIWCVLEKELQHLGYNFAGALYDGDNQGGKGMMRVYIDSPTGVTLDDCVQAGRSLGDLLDYQALGIPNYTLEISSPGLDRPLFTEADFLGVRGQAVKLRIISGTGSKKTLKGKLLACEDNMLTIEIGERQRTIALHDVLRANLIPAL